MNLLYRLFHSAAAWSFLATALRLGNAILVLPFILRHLTSEDLGWWYVFTSLASMAILMDMGFWPTISRSISYLWAGAPCLLPFGVAHGDYDRQQTDPNWAVLADLLTTFRWFYAFMGVFIASFMLPVGLFWLHGTKGATSIPYAAFSVYCISVAFGCSVAVWSAVLGGVNRVRESQQIVALAMLFNYATIILCLRYDAGLWSLVAGVWVKTVIERLGAFVSLRRAENRLLRLHGGFNWSLIKVTLPNAWRTGLTSIGTYLIVYANTLICSRFLGLQETASYGLSQQVTLLLIGTSGIWINVKIPLMAQLRARGALAELARLFSQRILLAIVTYLVGAILAFSFGQQMLQWIGSKTLLIPAHLFLLQLIIGFLEMHHVQYAILVVSDNHNPFVIPALLSGMVIILISMLLAPHYGILGLLISAGVVQASFNNWWPAIKGIHSLKLSVWEFNRLLWASHIAILVLFSRRMGWRSDISV